MTGNWGGFRTCPNGRYVDTKRIRARKLRVYEAMKDGNISFGGAAIEVREGTILNYKDSNDDTTVIIDIPSRKFSILISIALIDKSLFGEMFQEITYME